MKPETFQFIGQRFNQLGRALFYISMALASNSCSIVMTSCSLRKLLSCPQALSSNFCLSYFTSRSHTTQAIVSDRLQQVLDIMQGNSRKLGGDAMGYWSFADIFLLVSFSVGLSLLAQFWGSFLFLDPFPIQ